MTWLGTKAWWTSRTVWLGIVTALIGAGEALSDGTLLGAEATAWVLVVVGVLGVILRKLTETKI